jgi:hypothetical protein
VITARERYDDLLRLDVEHPEWTIGQGGHG